MREICTSGSMRGQPVAAMSPAVLLYRSSLAQTVAGAQTEQEPMCSSGYARRPSAFTRSRSAFMYPMVYELFAAG